MVKILVNDFPKNPSDCPFAIINRDKRCLANCQLKCNNIDSGIRYECFSYSPSNVTCSLHENKTCPYMR
jgi:hypothetical protein